MKKAILTIIFAFCVFAANADTMTAIVSKGVYNNEMLKLAIEYDALTAEINIISEVMEIVHGMEYMDMALKIQDLMNERGEVADKLADASLELLNVY
jgi:hypothetical protein